MKNTIKWLSIIFIIAITGFSMSCWDDSAKLIGVWEGDEGEIQIATNGNMIFSGMPGTWRIEENKLKFKAMGTMLTFPLDYNISGNTLTISYEGNTWTFTKKNL